MAVFRFSHLRWTAVPLTLAVVAEGLALYTVFIETTAKSILKDVYALRVGESSVSDVKALAERHGGAVSEYRCDAENCFASLQVYNTWLYRFRLEPAARFGAVVVAKSGKVDYIKVALERDTRAFPTSPSAGMTVEYLAPPRIYADKAPYWFPTPVGKPYLRVDLTTGATPVQRQHAYDYSFRCLTKLGRGCDLPCDYLPVAWHDWKLNSSNRGVRKLLSGARPM
jgi:hypothetical protein